MPTSCTPPFPKISTPSAVLEFAGWRPPNHAPLHVMDATSNPQTAAEQARKNYQDLTTPGAAVPENVRAMVEKAVDGRAAKWGKALWRSTAKSSISPSGM